MNSGKTTLLLQVAYNYEERDQRVLIAKPAVDSKGDDHVVSRLGVDRRVDFLITPQADPRQLFAQAAAGQQIDALLIDEAQFLTPWQVDQLMRIALIDGVPVLAYGIRSDFLTHGFPGSDRLLQIAHSIEELKTICRCGRKAIFNGRKVGQGFVFDGDQVAIDGVEVTYESLCGACYLRESDGNLGIDPQ